MKEAIKKRKRRPRVKLLQQVKKYLEEDNHLSFEFVFVDLPTKFANEGLAEGEEARVVTELTKHQFM